VENWLEKIQPSGISREVARNDTVSSIKAKSAWLVDRGKEGGGETYRMVTK